MDHNKMIANKFLTREVLILYTEQSARESVAMMKEKTSMMTSRKHYEHSTPWQPTAMRGAAMDVVVCSLGTTSSTPDYFGGQLGQETIINRRQIKQ
ncbi:MAG TPA: hypothetical protein VFM63_03875 [Pyrinomonadaceae bacterium]|nr:hypothetical protein [Pyrinomonadaceae bacterium]